MKILSCEDRLAAFVRRLRRRHLEVGLVSEAASLRALTSIVCDNAVLLVSADGRLRLFTDFRYVPMVHRLFPRIPVADLRRIELKSFSRIGFESSISQSRYRAFAAKAPRAKWVDIEKDILAVRSVKTPEEIAAIRAAEKLDCEIFRCASAKFRPGMTEREMARIIQMLMVELGDGEAFETIVSVGANAAECHHVPDGTVWNGREPVLIDMGVKLNGVCSDLTRNLLPRRMSASYRRAYELVRAANRAAIAAAKPGMTGRALDAVARRIIARGGFGKAFGHALGHGVGYEIHEAPTVSKVSDWILKPGMLLTIEPGIYLEGNLGIRIEDLVLITKTGCEVLSD